jgi:hypothetical protein
VGSGEGERGERERDPGPKHVAFGLESLDVSYWWTKLAFGNKEGEIVYLLKAISSSHSCLVKPLREIVKVNVFNHSLLYQHDYP